MSWMKSGGEWHEVKSTRIKESAYLVKTTCDQELVWDQVLIDRLPGGGEIVCKGCSASVVVEVPEPIKATPKKRTKKA